MPARSDAGTCNAYCYCTLVEKRRQHNRWIICICTNWASNCRNVIYNGSKHAYNINLQLVAIVYILDWPLACIEWHLRASCVAGHVVSVRGQHNHARNATKYNAHHG